MSDAISRPRNTDCDSRVCSGGVREESVASLSYYQEVGRRLEEWFAKTVDQNTAESTALFLATAVLLHNNCTASRSMLVNYCGRVDVAGAVLLNAPIGEQRKTSLGARVIEGR